MCDDTESDTESDFVEYLKEAIHCYEMNGESDDVSMVDAGRNMPTFADVGMLTYNKGLVVRLRDGTSMQITVVHDTRKR